MFKDILFALLLQYTYIIISTFTSVRPSAVHPVRPITSHFQFLQLYDKMKVITVALYVLRVKNMRSWSPSDTEVP